MVDDRMPEIQPVKRHSKYRGVTKHRRSGRWEAHIWLKKTGKQVYLGGYDLEEHAAEAYDLAAIKLKGEDAKLNFPPEKYTKFKALVSRLTLEELVQAVRKQCTSTSPARLSSSFRGVQHNAKAGLWEVRVQVSDQEKRVIGMFQHEQDAARAYDRFMVRTRGGNAAINYPVGNYNAELLQFHASQIDNLRESPRGSEEAAALESHQAKLQELAAWAAGAAPE